MRVGAGRGGVAQEVAEGAGHLRVREEELAREVHPVVHLCQNYAKKQSLCVQSVGKLHSRVARPGKEIGIKNRVCRTTAAAVSGENGELLWNRRNTANGRRLDCEIEEAEGRQKRSLYNDEKFRGKLETPRGI